MLPESEEEILENPLIQQPKLPKQHKLRNTENAATLVSQSSMIEDAKAAVDEIVEKVEDGWRCNACGKTTTRASDIRRHAEIHIEGLAFDCPHVHCVGKHSGLENMLIIINKRNTKIY